MRAIKFRGKANDGRWIYGGLVYSDDIEPAIYFEVGNKVKRMEWAYVDPATIGQFTGLHDKNGKEIFEGDIIKTDSAFIGVVRWSAFGYFFIFCEGDKIDPMDYSTLGYMLHACAFEIIGNVFDNPELLEEGGDK